MRSISIENLDALLFHMVGRYGLNGPLKTWYQALDPSDKLFEFDRKIPHLSVEHVTSHMVAAYLKSGEGQRNTHPAKTHHKLFEKRRANAVLTYQWKTSMKALLKLIKDSGIPLDTTSWIDVWFIDQNARNIPVELAISQEYYMLCPLHLVAASNEELDVLDRAWCIWELSLRAHAKKKALIMGNLKAKVAPYYIYLHIKLSNVKSGL